MGVRWGYDEDELRGGLSGSGRRARSRVRGNCGQTGDGHGWPGLPRSYQAGGLMPTPLEWLVMTGWPTIGELAGFSDVDRSTISRQLTGVDDDPQRLGWRRDGLVVSREAGRLLRPAERLLAGSKLLGEMFPRRHTHPAPDGHRHNPRLPRDYGHRHPNYFNGKQGAAFLFGRMEVIEVFYSLAPILFQGKGAEWSPTGLPLENHGVAVAQVWAACGGGGDV